MMLRRKHPRGETIYRMSHPGQEWPYHYSIPVIFFKCSQKRSSEDRGQLQQSLGNYAVTYMKQYVTFDEYDDATCSNTFQFPWGSSTSPCREDSYRGLSRSLRGSISYTCQNYVIHYITSAQSPIRLCCYNLTVSRPSIRNFPIQ